MTQQLISIGPANGGQGDSLFTLSSKANANFAEVYALTSAAVTAANNAQPRHVNLTALSQGTITGVGTTVNTLAAGNDSRIVGAVQQSALSAALDGAFSSSRGTMLYRGSAGWLALTPGAAGYVLQTGGSSADPSWVPPTSGAAYASQSDVSAATDNTKTVTPASLNTALRAVHLPTGVSFLRDFKTALGLPVELEDYGGVGDGTTDCSPAFNAAITAGVRTIRVRPAAVYKFASALPVIPYGLRITGHGMSTSVLDFYQASGSLLQFTGTTDNGGVLEGFTARARGGATLLVGLYLLANSSGASPDFFVARDLNITGFNAATDMFNYGIVADGNARTSTSLVGLRNLTLDNVKIFNSGVASGNAIDLRFVKDAGLHRISAFNTATGSTGNNKLSVGGTTASAIVHCTALDVGDIALDKVSDIGIDGTFQNLVATANTSRFNISGRGTSIAIPSGATDGRVTVNGNCSVTNNAGTTVKVTA